MINPAILLKAKSAWGAFKSNHPKFLPFLKAVNQSSLKEGSLIEIKVTTDTGKELSTNIRLNKQDEELIKDLTDLLSQG